MARGRKWPRNIKRKIERDFVNAARWARWRDMRAASNDAIDRWSILSAYRSHALRDRLCVRGNSGQQKTGLTSVLGCAPCWRRSASFCRHFVPIARVMRAARNVARFTGCLPVGTPSAKSATHVIGVEIAPQAVVGS